jgi:hypothetical protein
LLARGSTAKEGHKTTRSSGASDFEDPQGASGRSHRKCLSDDEEQFVRAFVEYWLRRGATLMDGTE